jgi:hypothetical protein
MKDVLNINKKREEIVDVDANHKDEDLHEDSSDSVEEF